jgi:hypothetical protein
MRLLSALVVLPALVAAVPTGQLSSATNSTLHKRATLKGIDVSDFTTGVNFNTVKANGVAFVYIKATEGTSACSLPYISHPKNNGTSSLHYHQRSSRIFSTLSSPEQPTPASSAAPTTSHTRTSPLERRRQPSSWLMEVVGQRMG